MSETRKAKAMKKKFSPLLGQVLSRIAPRIGAKVTLEPKWKIVGQVIFRNGKKRYFRYSSLDLNPLGASEIAKDKDYANFFMRKLGYPTIAGQTFFSDSWAKAIGMPHRGKAAAYRYALRLGFPVIVKPNSGSQGSGVALVHNKRELNKALAAVFKRDRVALVQRLVAGKDYRIVVLDGKVMSAYQRIPLNVMGDGKSSIAKLLSAKQRKFIASSRDTQIKAEDPRMSRKLARQGLSFASVPAKGELVYLLDNANLSTGGDSIDVTASMHPAWKRTAAKLTKDMGLRICGVDLMIAADIVEGPGKYWVLEINAAPGLDHYAQSGRAQERIVEDMYLQVLKSMGR
jgi:D-alanine-D-alanine ligase-like ATP-grasp enzyme